MFSPPFEENSCSIRFKKKRNITVIMSHTVSCAFYKDKLNCAPFYIGVDAA